MKRWRKTNRGEFISLEGYEDIMNTFQKLVEMPDQKELENELYKIGRGLRDDIRAKTPKSSGVEMVGAVVDSVMFAGTGVHTSGKSKWRKGGNLRKNIKVKKFRKKIKHSPAVFVALDAHPTKGAPHGYLVEYGSKGLRYGTRKKAGKSWIASFIGRNGQRVTVRIMHTGVMPPQPFFRPTVSQKKYSITEAIKKETEATIRKVVNEHGR